MKTILIDPGTRTITEHEYDGNLEGMYKLIGCRLVEAAAYQPNGDCLFVDEEGLLGNLQEQTFFYFDNLPFAGRAITVGCNDEGETTEASLTVEDLTKRVRWTTLTEIKEGTFYEPT